MSGPVWSKQLDSVIPTGPFELGKSNDSIQIKYFRKKHKDLADGTIMYVLCIIYKFRELLQ